MNTEYFIVKRILKNSKESTRFSKPIVNIAIVSIALSLAVMIIAIAIVTGFKKQITDKLVGIGADITIANLDNNFSNETIPVYLKADFLKQLKADSSVKSIYPFALKHAILKTQDEIQGVLIKGIKPNYDPSFFQQYLIEGNGITQTDSAENRQVIISKVISNALQAKVGDTILTYYMSKPAVLASNLLSDATHLSAFAVVNYNINPQSNFERFKKLYEHYQEIIQPKNIQPAPRAMKLYVNGIYETGMYDLDQQLILADMQIVQKMYGWTKNDITGFEVKISNFNSLEKQTDKINALLPSDLYASNVKENFPDIFGWLPTVDMNSIIIIVLMIVVSIMAMISTLLILILEKTNMIGILKALGMSNFNIRKIFLYQAGFIIVRGMIIGNIVGLLLCFLQLQFGIFKLDQESYYLSEIPILLNPAYIILINVMTFLVSTASLIIPTYLVTRITPLDAIRVD